jgi:hypothetical protein
MHAKKTRDRKKFFLEMSDKIISEMETESKALRDYLRTIGVLSEEEYQQRTLIDLKAREEIDNLKVCLFFPLFDMINFVFLIIAF